MANTFRTFWLSLLVAAFACAGQRDGATKTAAATAASTAEGALRRLYPYVTYRQLCETRARDGYVLTFRINAMDGGKEPNDIPAFPILVVPDSGLPRELARTLMNSPEVRNTAEEKGALLDSGEAVARARRLVPAATVLHCYIPLPGGAFVEQLLPDASVNGRTIGGVVTAVNAHGEAGITMRF
jgi:hypothetical protein